MSEPQTDVGRWCRAQVSLSTWERWEADAVPIGVRLDDIVRQVREASTPRASTELNEVRDIVRQLETGWPDEGRDGLSLPERIRIMVNKTRHLLEQEIVARQEAQRLLEQRDGDDNATLRAQRDEAAETAAVLRGQLEHMTAHRDRCIGREQQLTDLLAAERRAASRVAAAAHRLSGAVSHLTMTDLSLTAAPALAPQIEQLDARTTALVRAVTDEPDRPGLGATLGRLRAALNLEREDVARGIGLSAEQVAALEAGQAAPAGPVMAMVMGALVTLGDWSGLERAHANGSRPPAHAAGPATGAAGSE